MKKLPLVLLTVIVAAAVGLSAQIKRPKATVTRYRRARRRQPPAAPCASR